MSELIKIESITNAPKFTDQYWKNEPAKFKVIQLKYLNQPTIQ
jgi:hypothetical protein